MSDLKDRIRNDFQYHPPKDAVTVELHGTVRDRLQNIALWIESATPAGREQALAITKLEEAMFWANAAIARNS